LPTKFAWGRIPSFALVIFLSQLGCAEFDKEITMRSRIAPAIFSMLLMAGPAFAQNVIAELKAADGASVGTATLTQTAQGVLIKLSVQKLSPGDHALHLHAVGECTPPFTSAGGHFNPAGKKHGMMAADGQHAGDMPNLNVPASGAAQIEVLNTAVTLAKGAANSLLDADGSALVIHAQADDYKSDPTGEAGGRIVCGVIK
jgi:superoxide dismutase, Cu-Zn family